MIFITPSEAIEYIYCPRFLYFMNVLKIDQKEHQRKLVNKGRDIHKLKLVRNKKYLRKKIGAVRKSTDVYLTSKKLNIVGKVDEVLFLQNNTACPLDYKYAFWQNLTFNTHKIQQTMYALLIEENFNTTCNNAYIVYIRTNNLLKKIKITPKLRKKTIKYIKEMFDIMNLNYFPEGTSDKKKCADCTYRNICIS